jgi:hypothetical protein
MATILTAGTTTATSFVIASDTSGTLAFVGGTGTAMTIASGVVTLTTPLAITSGGTGTNTATGSGYAVLATSPTLVTPNLGTPTTLVGTNITGTAAGLSIGGNAATATNATNATQITNTGGWNITPTGTKLYFNYNGTNVASLDSSGNFKVLLTTQTGTTP